MANRMVSARLGLAFAASMVIAACSSESEPAAAPTTASTTSMTTSTTTSAATSTTIEILPAVPATGSTRDGSLTTDDGRTRTYRVYEPSQLPTSLVPLLLALHGGTGSGRQFERNSGFDELAEANGFLAVYPDGTEIGAGVFARGRVWNGGACCGPAARDNVDDVAFIAALLDEIERDYSIDPARVFVAGHSNGGIMAYRLACELSDRIAAIGLQAGWLGVDDCDPSRPVSVLHVHGTADENAPIDGGIGEQGISGVAARPALRSVTGLASADGCEPPPETTVDGDLTTSEFSACPDGVAVRLVAVRGASHAWMGHAATSPAVEALVGEPYLELDASAVIWAFLAQHPRAASSSGESGQSSA